MAKSEKILAVDIGSTSIKLCEFDFTHGDAVNLTHFSQREYEEELSDNTRMGVVAGLLRQMLAEGGFEAKKCLVCMSGQLALTRFNRLPIVNVDSKKLKQLAEFEATQNIPFPISEVLWDYQLIANSSSDSVDVMSVVIKNDIVEQFTNAIAQVGCQPLLIDVAPAACYNTARACGLGENGECHIILNMGGRVTNLIFIEGERLFARTIPIAGYTITQQIAKEFGIGQPEAEELKRRHGFVSLGGAYAEPESETAANVSKIIRNVMSRLLGEITRTVNVYRAQQKGGKPTKMFITGGTSILTYCDTFFAEKMGIPVEYFNPFKCVSLAPSVDKQRLVEVGHMFSEAIGLGLRYASQCPVELSLIPANIRRQQDFDKKKPFFILSFVCIILMLLVVLFGLSSRIQKYELGLNELKKEESQARKYIKPVEENEGKVNAAKSTIEDMGKTLLKQAQWPAILNELYRLKPDNLWITSLTPVEGEVKEIKQVSTAEMEAKSQAENSMFGGMDMFGSDMGGMGGEGNAQAAASGTVTKIGGLILNCTAVAPTTEKVTFTVGKAFPFPFETTKAPEEDTSSEQGEGEGSAAKPKTPEQKTAEIMKAAGNTPAEAFVAALRQSAIFDSDDKMTTITQYYAAGEWPRNYANVSIQVKFSIPVEYYKVKGEH